MLHSELIPAADHQSRKLMIMLHGLGDSIEGYRWMPEAMGLADMNYLLVNAPDEYFGGYSWFDFTGDMVPGVQRSREMLIALLDQQRQHGFETGSMVLGGFSQGCLMALDVGLRYPHLFAAIVGISGWICEPEQLICDLSPFARQQHILMTHGTLDPMVPITPVRGQVEMLQTAGIQIEWHEFAKPHTIDGENELSVIRRFVKRACASSAKPEKPA